MTEMRLIRHCAEFLERNEIVNVPRRHRGIYALLQKQSVRGRIKYDLVYIGMSTSCIRSRLKVHEKSLKKAKLWSHFSVYSVWPNITDAEITELEGLFRAIYRRDSNANSVAVQKGFKKLRLVRNNKFNWVEK